MNKQFEYLNNKWTKDLEERRKKMNLNKVARDITLAEGLKHQIKIGDAKELLRLIFTKYSLLEVIKIWMKYNIR